MELSAAQTHPTGLMVGESPLMAGLIWSCWHLCIWRPGWERLSRWGQSADMLSKENISRAERRREGAVWWERTKVRERDNHFFFFGQFQDQRFRRVTNTRAQPAKDFHSPNKRLDILTAYWQTIWGKKIPLFVGTLRRSSQSKKIPFKAEPQSRCMVTKTER